MTWRDDLTFLSHFVRSPRAIGAVSPSSRQLARRMVEWIEWSNVRGVAEYGPGTGAFTQLILEQLRPETTFFAIESNPDFVAILGRRLPDVCVYHESVQNIATLCRRQGIRHLDAVICGLPWASFTSKTQDQLLDATSSVLCENGQFVTFAYLQGLLLPAGRRFKRKLVDHFRHIESSQTVWQNFPPAFVYRCRR